MAICTGTGSGGDHCCYILGDVCEFLDTRGEVPRCGVWDHMDLPEWHQAPVGRWFAETYPGFNCKDWPQRIPAVTGKLCCWEGGL